MPQDSNGTGALIPDREQIAAFISLMFKNARDEGLIALRSFVEGDDRNKAILTEWVPVGDPLCLDTVYERARQAATWSKPTVFCPPVATFTKYGNARTDNLHDGVVLSVECDKNPRTARQTLTTLLGEPTAVTESGGLWTDPESGEVEAKVHLHWRLKQPTSDEVAHARLKKAREIATKLVGGDGTAVPLVHPFRWPGSWHRKAAPRLAKIVASSEHEIDLSAALDALRDAADAAGAADFGDEGVRETGRLGADDHDAVASALAAIPNDDLEWDEWNRIGMAAWAASGGAEAGRAAFAAWSAKAKKNDPAATEARWQHYSTSPPTKIGFGTLVWLARQHSPGWNYQKAGSITVDELNERYCVVCDKGQTRVLTFERQTQRVGKRTHERYVPTLMRFEDFANFYLDEKIQVGKKSMPLGRWWLQTGKADNPGKLKFDGLVFRPDVDVSRIDGKLNLWRGFGVEEHPGDWSLMRRHIEIVLASNNKDHAAYIINWIAWAVQNPADRAEVALVFRGKKGTGKGTLGNSLVILFGRHGTHISSKDHLAGKFNYHLRDACFLFADEAYWPGDRAAEGNLKRLITEPDLFIEGKGQNAFPAPNLLHVLMASNEEWIVPAGENERRYMVFDVSTAKMQNEAWFSAIYRQMENGGYEAMLYDLRRLDLKGWHPRKLVTSQALLSQQAKSLDFFDEWWSSLLENGVIPGSSSDYPNCSPPLEDYTVPDDITGRETPVPGLLSRARKSDPMRGSRMTEGAFGRALRKAGCIKKRIYYAKRQRRTWRFTPLHDARKAWEMRFPGWPWAANIVEWRTDADEVGAAGVSVWDDED